MKRFSMMVAVCTLWLLAVLLLFIARLYLEEKFTPGHPSPWQFQFSLRLVFDTDPA